MAIKYLKPKTREEIIGHLEKTKLDNALLSLMRDDYETYLITVRLLSSMGGELDENILLINRFVEFINSKYKKN